MISQIMGVVVFIVGLVFILIGLLVILYSSKKQFLGGDKERKTGPWDVAIKFLEIVGALPLKPKEGFMIVILGILLVALGWGMAGGTISLGV